MERPAWAPQGIDISVPSVSRMYDFYLGGSHNFEVDREAARKAMEFMPGLPKAMQANRAFMRRAVRYALSEGVTQFLDIGSGIPTFGNVHEVAQAIDPAARVAYVDHDPVAVAHSQAVLEGNEGATISAADLRKPPGDPGQPRGRQAPRLRPPPWLCCSSPSSTSSRTPTTRAPPSPHSATCWRPAASWSSPTPRTRAFR